MTGKMRVWPVKSTIRPDTVRWLAIIFSPEPKGQIILNWLPFSSVGMLHWSAEHKAQDPTPTRQPAKVITKIWDAYHLHKTPGEGGILCINVKL